MTFGIRDQLTLGELVFAVGAFGEGMGLGLGIVVSKIKSHCKSMKGLVLRTAEKAAPQHHLGAPEVRKASQPLLICSSWP